MNDCNWWTGQTDWNKITFVFDRSRIHLLSFKRKTWKLEWGFIGSDAFSLSATGKWELEWQKVSSMFIFNILLLKGMEFFWVIYNSKSKIEQNPVFSNKWGGQMVFQNLLCATKPLHCSVYLRVCTMDSAIWKITRKSSFYHLFYFLLVGIFLYDVSNDSFCFIEGCLSKWLK